MAIATLKKAGHIVRDSFLNHVKDGVNKRRNIFLISYTKVSSGKMDDFRKILHRAGAEVYVSKNTIAERALRELKFERLAERIKGQTAFILSDADTVEISKALTKFVKTCDGILVQGGLLQGEVLEKKDVERLSELPAREVLIATLLGTLQSPIVRFASALNSKTYDLLNVLKQVSEQKK